MLDSDVAMLYHYETKNINKAVKRNIERFGPCETKSLNIIYNIYYSSLY